MTGTDLSFFPSYFPFSPPSFLPLQQDDVAYGTALMRGASRSEAEAAAQAARDEQEAKFEAGVAKAKELNPKAGTYWSDRPGPMGMASFQ
jgi:hypothetical protein